jgi:hypothetical protein
VKLGEEAALSLFLEVCALDIDADIAEPERRTAYQGTHDHDRKRTGYHASTHDDHGHGEKTKTDSYGMASAEPADVAPGVEQCHQCANGA